MDMITRLKESPLHSFHVQLGARMVDFAGWNMPVMYRGIIDEHNHTRNACSLFDVSHMGRLYVNGTQAGRFLDLICTRDMADMTPGLSRYTHVCKEDGGILDDVIVSRFTDKYLVVCNASNRDKIVAWLKSHTGEFEVTIDDQTESTAMVALQGPKAVPTVEKLLNIDLSDLQNYHFRDIHYMTFPCTIFRGGYTGEDGVEIILPINLIKLAMQAIVGMGNKEDDVVKPAGLGARDSLRLEAGMPLYGHELSEEWDSLTARQGWCVNLEKDFIGAECMRKLKAEGLSRRIVGLELEGKRTARQGYRVLIDNAPVGVITSGVFSPTLGKSVAMAMLDFAHNQVGTKVEVEFGGKTVPAEVVKLPFYKRQKN